MIALGPLAPGAGLVAVRAKDARGAVLGTSATLLIPD